MSPLAWIVGVVAVAALLAWLVEWVTYWTRGDGNYPRPSLRKLWRP